MDVGLSRAQTCVTRLRQGFGGLVCASCGRRSFTGHAKTRWACRSERGVWTIEARQPEPGTLVHHSDRGLQYACSDYTDILNANGILTSMSRVANPYGTPIHTIRDQDFPEQRV